MGSYGFIKSPLYAAAAKALKGHLHVALSASQPHLADKDVLNRGNGFLTHAEGEVLRGKGGLGSSESEEPTTIGIGLSCDFALAVPGSDNRDLLAWGGGTLQADLSLLL